MVSPEVTSLLGSCPCAVRTVGTAGSLARGLRRGPSITAPSHEVHTVATCPCRRYGPLVHATRKPGASECCGIIALHDAMPNIPLLRTRSKVQYPALCVADDAQCTYQVRVERPGSTDLAVHRATTCNSNNLSRLRRVPRAQSASGALKFVKQPCQACFE